MSCRKLIYFFLFSFFWFLGKSQKLEFDNYTSKHGLISDDVYKIFQDHKGYIWLFTDYGAMKYNGKKFEQTLKNIPFKESFIYSFYENDKGQLWVANSNAKIYEVRNDSAFLIKGTEIISEQLKKSIAEITQLVVDDSLNIYAVTKLFTYKFPKKNNYLRGEKLNYQLDKDTIAYNVICVNNDLLPEYLDAKNKHLGAYFLNHNTIKVKIKCCDNKEEIFDIPSSVLTGPKFFKKYGSNIYICFYNKIVKICSDKSIKEIPLNSIITSFVKDKNDHLWVGCVNNGLFEIDQHDSIVHHYLNDKTVNEVLIDSQNGLWLSTEGFGLYHCKGSNTYYYDKNEPLGLPISLMKKIDDKIFIFNNQGDLFIVEKNGLTQVKKSNDIGSEPLDIIKYHSLYLISYRHKTEYFDLKKGVVKVIVATQKTFYVPYRYSFIDKDTLLLVRRNGLRKVYNDSLLQKIDFNFKVFDCIVRDGKIIITTDEGLYEYYNNKLSRPDHFKITQKCVISKIVEGKFGDLWFCSKGYGLFKLTPNNELKHYTINNGLPSNIINDISFNNDHSILLSTNIGLFHSCKYKKWIQIYQEQVESAIQDKNDVYFSTKNGLIVFKDIKPNEEHPIYFNLSSLFVNAKLSTSKQIEHLKHDQNNIEFNFDVISFSSNVSDIIYQLSGSANNIGITKNQQIIFQNLAPGTYTLTASLVANYNKSSSIVIPFVITPAFWQTVLFKILVFIIMFLLCFLIFRITFRYYKNKENRENKIEKLIIEYKLIALKAQINPHFMSNCLTAIQQLIISNKIDEANQYLAKFSFLVRQVLNFSSKMLVSLAEELQITKLNIELEQLRFENKFEFISEIDKDIDLKKIVVPPLIFQPIIENAIWHGLLPLRNKRKGVLRMKIYIFNQSLIIVIEDNGVGRSTNTDVISNLKDSKGMNLINQRIQSLNNFYKTDNGKLLFEDLFDDSDNPLGSRITITLPIFNSKKV